MPPFLQATSEPIPRNLTGTGRRLNVFFKRIYDFTFWPLEKVNSTEGRKTH